MNDKMTDPDEQDLRAFLKREFALFETELQRDLWPRIIRRLDAKTPRVPWFDWALAAAVAAMLLLFPNVIPALLYQL
jgi:hypothetical protein